MNVPDSRTRLLIHSMPDDFTLCSCVAPDRDSDVAVQDGVWLCPERLVMVRVILI
jgi:hypothetical protein